jgi:uncharacterized repeat protein (TIGR04076 family)
MAGDKSTRVRLPLAEQGPRPPRARAGAEPLPVACTPMTSDLRSEVHSCAHLCKYYRDRPSAEPFEGAPRGLCPHLFMVAYPFALGMLYGARYPGMTGDDELPLACPSESPAVRFTVRRVLRPRARRAFDRVKALVAKPFTKIDRIEYRIFIRIDSVSGRCPALHFIDQHFEFNTGESHEECPAVFANIYPTMMALRGGGTPRWSAERERFTFCCPDNESDLTFRAKAVLPGLEAEAHREEKA